MWDFAKKMAIKAIQKQAAPFLTAHCPESLQPRLAELLADEQAISSLLSYLYDVGTGNKSFSLKELDFLPISSGSNSELLNYVVPSLVSKLPIKLSPSSRFGAEIKKMLIKLLQSQAAPYLLKKCPSALQAPLAQLLSDDMALSSLMSYIYALASGETSFSMGTLQQLPMKPATRKMLSTPGLLKHIFTAIQPLLRSLPGKLSCPVPEEVAFSSSDTPYEAADEKPQNSGRRKRAGTTGKAAGRKRKITAAEVETVGSIPPPYGASSADRAWDAGYSRPNDTQPIYLGNYPEPVMKGEVPAAKIAILPALVAGGLSVSGLLSTFYALYYAICYDFSIAFSVSSILGYLVLGAGIFLGNKWILKPYLSGRDSGDFSRASASSPVSDRGTSSNFPTQIWDSFTGLFRSREKAAGERKAPDGAAERTYSGEFRGFGDVRAAAYRADWKYDASLSYLERGMCYARALACYDLAAENGDEDADDVAAELRRRGPDSIVSISYPALAIALILIVAGLISIIYGLDNLYYGYINTYCGLSLNEIVCGLMGVGIFIGDEWVRKPWCRRRALRRGAAIVQRLHS